MQLNNPLQMNDWEIKKFLKVILAIQLAMWGVIGLDVVGIQIPIIRQLIGFIYLTFIPGILILRVLKLHKLGNIEILLYTVGLSIVTLMFTGFFMNTIYPLLGISGPISFTPLIITISMVVLVLCILSYVRDKNFTNPSFIEFKNVLSPPALFLCLLPFLAIFGTYFVNFYQNNILLMFLIVIIALIVLSIAFDKFIPSNLYPLAVFVIAMSLLFHHSLISMYLTGWDIHGEYHFHKLVVINGFWDSSIRGNVNAMLSVVMVPAIYSQLLNMKVTWVFKVIYPLLFSFLPLGLYHVFREQQINEKTAFFSAFYMMSIYVFYTEMISLARQEIAEIMLLILIMIIISKKELSKRRILLIFIGVGLITSHYGLSYLFMLFLLFAYVFMALILKYKSDILTLNYSIIFIVIGIAWYMFVTSGSIFEQIVSMGSHLYNTFFTEILVTKAATLVTNKSASLTGQILKILYWMTQFFIVVGVIKVLLKEDFLKESKFKKEYVALSFACFGILILAIITTSTGMNIHRLYQIVSIFLSPFCIIGGNTIFKMIRVNNFRVIVYIIIILFFLFNTGIVSELVNDPPRSISLCQERVMNSKNVEYKAFFYDDCNTFEQDVYGIRWFSMNAKNDAEIYSDYITGYPLYGYGMGAKPRRLSNTTDNIKRGSYIYLGYANIVGNVLLGPKPVGLVAYNTTEMYPLLDLTNKLYSNGGSEIYFK